MTYDRTTGIRTYKPANIEGNWRIGYTGDFNMPLGKQRLWWLGCNTQAGYRNYAEYTSVDGESSQRSSIHRSTLGISPYGSFQKGEYRFSLRTSVTWSNMNGNLSQTTNIFESYCQLALNMPLPLGVRLNTTFNVYSHRGYKESNYNNEELIWSASLTKSVLKGKLLFTLDAFDILDNIRSTSYSITAQTQKEIYRNTLHRYAMLHVAYKMNFKPKKKEK